MADQTLQVLGATDNVKIDLAPKDASGNPTKFDTATPPAFTATGGTIDADGLWVIPSDFDSNAAPLTATVTYKALTYTVEVTGKDAEVTDLGVAANVVPK